MMRCLSKWMWWHQTSTIAIIRKKMEYDRNLKSKWSHSFGVNVIFVLLSPSLSLSHHSSSFSCWNRVHACDNYSTFFLIFILAMKRTIEPHKIEQLNEMLNSRLGIVGMCVRVYIGMAWWWSRWWWWWLWNGQAFHYMVSTSWKTDAWCVQKWNASQNYSQ